MHWNPSPEEPFTCMSVSDDSEEDGTGGGSLQIWRINDLIWRPEKVQYHLLAFLTPPISLEALYCIPPAEPS